MKIHTLLLIIITYPAIILAKPTIVTEDLIYNLAKKQAPMLKKIRLQSLSTNLSSLQYEEQFSPILYGNASYLKSDEKSLAAFDNVTKSYSTQTLGVKKKLILGADVSAEIFNQKVTNNFINNSTISGVNFNLSISLLKNFLGAIDKNTNNLHLLRVKRSELEESINKQNFLISLRKLYFSLVANKESIQLMEKSLELSNKQLKEAKRRYRNKIADLGELSRYQAGQASKNSSLISLKYQRSNILKELKKLLPDLAHKEIIVGNYNIDKGQKSVLQCAMKISSFSQTPLQFTPYDEILKILKKENIKREQITSDYNKPNLNLDYQLRKTGKAFSVDEAMSDFRNDGRTDQTIGLTLNFPLGKTQKTSKEILQKIDQLDYQSQVEEKMGLFNSYHTQTISSITYLNSALKNLELNSKFLATSIKESGRKYRQARITVDQLLNEQDSHIQSELNEIKTKLTVMNIMLDYFNVFTETPCEINGYKL